MLAPNLKHYPTRRLDELEAALEFVEEEEARLCGRFARLQTIKEKLVCGILERLEVVDAETEKETR